MDYHGQNRTLNHAHHSPIPSPLPSNQRHPPSALPSPSYALGPLTPSPHQDLAPALGVGVTFSMPPSVLHDAAHLPAPSGAKGGVGPEHALAPRARQASHVARDQPGHLQANRGVDERVQSPRTVLERKRVRVWQLGYDQVEEFRGQREEWDEGRDGCRKGRFCSRARRRSDIGRGFVGSACHWK